MANSSPKRPRLDIPSDSNRPRLDFLTVSDYFMAVALLAETRSTETKKVGACVVKDQDVVGIGYNQMIAGCDDRNKKFYEYHAEMDAIMSCSDVKGCTLYVTVYPCNECMKLIIQAGIKTVVYLRKDQAAAPNTAFASGKMFFEANIQCLNFKYRSQREDLTITFLKEENPEPDNMERSDMDDFFMSFAILTSMRSRDPNTQVGACIIRDNTKVISVGYNQMPKGENDKYTWARDGKDNKYLYVCHAELNAVVSSTDVKGCTVYVTLFPCEHCAKLLIKAGIKTVVYLSNKYAGAEGTKASRKMLKANGVELKSFYKPEDPERQAIIIKFE